MNRLKKLMLLTIFILTGLVATTFLFMQQSTFGRDPAEVRLERIKRSPNYREGVISKSGTYCRHEGKCVVHGYDDGFLQQGV